MVTPWSVEMYQLLQRFSVLVMALLEVEEGGALLGVLPLSTVAHLTSLNIVGGTFECSRMPYQ